MRKYDKVMMKTAKAFSRESYCIRKRVGCVIAKDGRIISTGYNGTIKGMSNTCEDETVICSNCDSVIPKGEDSCSCGLPKELGSKTIITNEFTLHAEQNAITYAAKEGLSVNNTTMYITLSPCKTCAKLIASSGISRVVYKDVYKDMDGIEFLSKIPYITVSKY